MMKEDCFIAAFAVSHDIIYCKSDILYYQLIKYRDDADE